MLSYDAPWKLLEYQQSGKHLDARLPVLLFLSCLFCACGGSDPGRGTQDLYVEAHATSSGRNASTEIRVQVRANDASGPVQRGARVTVRGSSQGEWTLSFREVPGPRERGFHQVTGLDWQKGWHLDVEIDEDRWLKAYLKVPGLTSIVEPSKGISYRPSEREPLEVVWDDSFSRDQQRIRVSLNRNSYSEQIHRDARRHEIEASVFRRNGSEELKIQRWNEIELAGGASGSYFRGTTEGSVSFVVE